MQHLRDQRRPVAHFSKQLDGVSQEWAGCLKAVVATVILIQEAHKFTHGQHKFKYMPHAVITVLEQKGVGAASYLLAECLSITLYCWNGIMLL